MWRDWAAISNGNLATLANLSLTPLTDLVSNESDDIKLPFAFIICWFLPKDWFFDSVFDTANPTDVASIMLL